MATSETVASENITRQIREKARELLSCGQVELVIGYRRASDGVTARPAFVRKADDADLMIFDETCTHNLAKYVIEKRGKSVAVVAKACDTFGLNVLIQEKQIDREKLYVIGVNCPGVKETSFGRLGSDLQFRCRMCQEHTPALHDYVVGEAVQEKPLDFDPYARVRELESLSHEERIAFWEQQFSRCIRCYACRNACPQCYCTECVVEQIDPNWVGTPIQVPEKQIFHIIRAFHLAGRCIGCNECERACPVGIPLSLMNMKFSLEVEQQFGFKPGRDPEVCAPLATFQPDEELGLGD
ncbi:MAG: 4Fe-4S dicluster domain-containing protein [Dehalococcoidia bacterium]|nr:4Fe-4S dicluster domain-containing protein [Dehalococcoidia bacterium]